MSLSAGGTPEFDDEFDAGEMGCGELVLELKFLLGQQASGYVLKLRALDPGAPEDLPAWCRMTRHRLLLAQHPHYWIQRRKDREP
jgi:tRNA 2-thiouridine synthesizing protein A